MLRYRGYAARLGRSTVSGELGGKVTVDGVPLTFRGADFIAAVKDFIRVIDAQPKEVDRGENDDRE